MEDIAYETDELREEELINRSGSAKWKSRFIQIHNLVNAEKSRKNHALNEQLKHTQNTSGGFAVNDWYGEGDDEKKNENDTENENDLIRSMTTQLAVTHSVNTGEFKKAWVAQMQVWSREDDIENNNLRSRGNSRAGSRSLSRGVMTAQSTGSGRNVTKSMSSSLLFNHPLGGMTKAAAALGECQSVPNLIPPPTNLKIANIKQIVPELLQPQDNESEHESFYEDESSEMSSIFHANPKKIELDAKLRAMSQLDGLAGVATPAAQPAIEQLLFRKPINSSILDRDYEWMEKVKEEVSERSERASFEENEHTRDGSRENATDEI